MRQSTVRRPLGQAAGRGGGLYRTVSPVELGPQIPRTLRVLPRPGSTDVADVPTTRQPPEDRPMQRPLMDPTFLPDVANAAATKRRRPPMWRRVGRALLLP